MEQHYLGTLFAPASIVVFAGRTDEPASQGPYGAALLAQLREGGFSGPLSFLDAGIGGTLGDLAQSGADLALIAVGEQDQATALEVAGRIRCRAALVIGAGAGQAHARLLQAIARQHGMHLLGPNGLGFQRPGLRLNASVAGPLARCGTVGLVSQSGALTAAMLDWAASHGVGFSSVVSLGPNALVDLAQVLDFLVCDAATRSIVVCMEGISTARPFLSALRAAASIKPVVVLKSGRHAQSHTAALTHCGAIVGSDKVIDAALRRAGAVRVDSVVQLFSAVKCLASRHRPVGRRLAVLSNGGGPGLLAADRIATRGLELAQLAPALRGALAAQLAPLASLDGLIELSGQAVPEHYLAALAACGADPAVDGVLLICAPHLGCDPQALAAALIDCIQALGKPLLTCWIGEVGVAGARRLLSGAEIAVFSNPEAAVDAFASIADFYHNQELLRQTPPPLSQLVKPDLQGARMLVESVLAERRQVLTEIESKALLAAFHIPITHTVLARSATEAMLVASQLGFPVALKIDSPDIAHKSDVDGVILNVPNAASVRALYEDLLASVRRLAPQARIHGVTVQKMSGMRRGRELFIGVRTDQPFGPVIAFGAGGTMIELMDDCAVELPPLNQFLARGLMRRVRVASSLAAWHGAPAANVEAVEQILLRVSEMVCALPQLREMDINPLIVDSAGALAVDARIVVAPAPPAQQYEHLAILPYPTDYAQDWPLPGGAHYSMRALQPDDADMLQELVQGLSDQSRHMRFAYALRQLSATMLARFTLIDYTREMALVAVHRERSVNASGQFVETEQMIGVAHYVREPDLASCEFSLMVADAWAGQGIGTRLMLALMDAARVRGLAEIDGLVLSGNSKMLKLVQQLGFQVSHYEDDPDYRRCSKVL